MDLDEARESIETGLEPKMVLHLSMFTVIVVLKGAGEGYDCHTYRCYERGRWAAAVDKRGADFEAVLKWIDERGCESAM